MRFIRSHIFDIAILNSFYLMHLRFLGGLANAETAKEELRNYIICRILSYISFNKVSSL